MIGDCEFDSDSHFNGEKINNFIRIVHLTEDGTKICLISIVYFEHFLLGK